jgi:hypothetical protein
MGDTVRQVVNEGKCHCPRTPSETSGSLPAEVLAYDLLRPRHKDRKSVYAFMRYADYLQGMREMACTRLAGRHRSVYSLVDTRSGCDAPRETSPRGGWSREDYAAHAAHGRIPGQQPNRVGHPDDSQ